MTEIEEKIVSTLRWKKRRNALTVAFAVTWGLFLALWWAGVDPDQTFRRQLLIFLGAIGLPLSFTMRRMLARETVQAEHAMTAGDPKNWFRTFLDRGIRDARFSAWLAPLMGSVLAFAIWKLHAPGTENRFIAGLFGLVAFTAGLTLWAVRELRQLRRERASI